MWNEFISYSEIKGEITPVSVDFAKRFGEYLGTDLKDPQGKPNRDTKLTTSQLRKFFGEIKRQQMNGYNPTDFILLKPKLAYAVGRAKKKENKIADFYKVIANAVDQVSCEKEFNNFVKIVEAIVAYHKATENGAKLDV